MGKPDQAAAAEEARRATGDAAGRGRGGRLSARRKRETVLRLLRGEDLESVSRELGITAARAAHGGISFEASLKSRAPDAWDEANPAASQDPDGERTALAKVDQLEVGDGGRGDEGRPLDLHAAGVWRAAGLPVPQPVPPQRDFDPVADKRETPTGLAHRKVGDPTAQDGVDALHHPTDRLRPVPLENLLWVRSFDTIEELRLALLEFKRTYNEQWMLEKYHYQSPAQVRREFVGLDAAA